MNLPIAARRSVLRAMGAVAVVLCAEATKQGWTVISMKDDWKKIFAFDD